MQSLIEQLQQQQQDTTATAWQRYIEILGRNANPKPGDAEALLALLPTIGVTAAEAERHAAVIAEDRRYDGAEKGLQTAREKLAAVAAELKTAETKAGQLEELARQTRNTAQSNSNAALSQVFTAEGRVDRRNKLRAENWRLFNLPDPNVRRPAIVKSDAQVKAESFAGGMKYEPEYQGLSWPALVALVMAEAEAARFVATTIGIGELVELGKDGKPSDVLAHLIRLRVALSPVNVTGVGDGTFHTTDEILARAAAKHEAKTTRSTNGRFVSVDAATE